MNHLAGSGNIVVVNHPSSFHGYNASDFRYLRNYNCMEVLSPYAISTACWDTALSNGKPVFIVGNDDEHNIFSKNSVGRMCTCINASSIDQRAVLNALKNGKKLWSATRELWETSPCIKQFKTQRRHDADRNE